MFKKKCPACAQKIEKKFNYCPWCGVGFKQRDEKESFGMLGRDDSVGKVVNEMKLPFGMNTIVNSLVKQLEKQMGNLGDPNSGNVPKSFKIQISSGSPQIRQVMQKAPEKKVINTAEVSDKENERRRGLPRVEVESKIKRLGNTIIYEIETPGIKKKEDVVLTELATGLEIKAYSKDKCYVKFIPLKVEVVEYYVKKEKVVVEIKG